MSPKTRILKIDELNFDDDLYPRLKVNWLTAYQYAQAMRAGATFPPILVGKYGGKMYVVDGWHRVKAYEILKEEYIEAIIKNYSSRREMLVDAINANIAHGRPLSVQEKVRLVEKLSNEKFTVEQISQILRIPVDQIEKFKARTIYTPSGEPIYLKSIVAKSKPTANETLTVNMEKFNVRTVIELLEQLIELLESNIFPWHDEKVRELAIKTHNLLNEKLTSPT